MAWTRTGRIAVRGVLALVVLVALCSCSSTTTTDHSAAASASVAPTSASTTTEPVDPDEATDPTAANAAPPPAASTATDSNSPACRTGDPLANVYHPSRLRVIHGCMTVSGTVASVRHEDDGDYHINVDLDPHYASLINIRNVAGEHSALVVEIVPADEAGCTVGQPPQPAHGTYDYGICTGANETAPAVGSHVAVTGPYILDTAHGWMEIHPAWSVAPFQQPTTTPPPTPTPPTSPPAAVAPPPSTTSPPAGGTHSAGQYCSSSDVGNIETAGNGRTIQCKSDISGRNRWTYI